MSQFKCQTVAQFKVMSWLAAQGIESEDVASVELLEADRVKIVNPAGQYMVVRWAGDRAEIEGADRVGE